MAPKTPNRPDLSETDLRAMKVDELRNAAKDAGVDATSTMRKGELVDAVSRAHRESAPNEGSGESAGGEAGTPDDAGADDGRLRTGNKPSRSVRFSQEVTSPDDEPERAGRSLATTNHEVIRRWAEERDGIPATVAGTDHDLHLGVLRFDFGGDSDRLAHVSWDEWFETFDARRLNFVYQEERTDGRATSSGWKAPNEKAPDRHRRQQDRSRTHRQGSATRR